MRPNTVETVVQCSACRCLPDFLVMIISIPLFKTYIYCRNKVIFIVGVITSNIFLRKKKSISRTFYYDVGDVVEGRTVGCKYRSLN